MLKTGILVAALAASAASGFWLRAQSCDAAEARRALAAEKLRHAVTRAGLDAAQLSADFDFAARKEIEQRAQAREEQIRDLQSVIANAPAGRCRLGADGRRRLLNIYQH